MKTSRLGVCSKWCPFYAGLFVLAALAPAFLVAGEINKSTNNNAAAESRLAESVKYLASDELEGRGVGTDGLNKAADYIAAEFSKIGLRTDVFDGSPFQVFETPADAKLGPPEKNTLALIAAAGEDGSLQRTELKAGADFNTMALGGTAKLQAPLVFVGYGITAKDPEFDEYAGIDVKGKVVIILRKEPEQDNPHSKFAGTRSSQHAFFTSKVSNAFTHGAAGVILLNDAFDLSQRAENAEKNWRDAVAEIIKVNRDFRAQKEPSAEERAKYFETLDAAVTRAQELDTKMKTSPDTLLPFNGAGQSDKYKSMPVYFCTRAAIDPVVKAALGKDLAALEREIDEDLKPRSVELTGFTVDCQSDVEHRRVEVKNVVGVLEGEGPLASETIIVGAHYDHLGLGGSGSLAPWTAAIHNGADDNASGTAALIEVARRIAGRETSSRRRIVFIAFTGEERGLLGSSYYVKNPAFPLEQTVAMVNMDMVGRLKDDKLVLYGTGTATEFDGMIDDVNKKHGFKITKKPSGYGPSDHQSFYEKQIPVFHFFTDTHSDYHRPSDDFDKVNVPGMRRVADMVGDVVEWLDGAEKRPEYQKTKRPQVSRGSAWPYFGSIPDYASEEEGLALKDVAEGGPAAKAGLKGGDVIIKFGKAKIGSVQDFAAVLGQHKGGEKVVVVAKRGKETITVTVILGDPK